MRRSQAILCWRCSTQHHHGYHHTSLACTDDMAAANNPWSKDWVITDLPDRRLVCISLSFIYAGLVDTKLHVAQGYCRQFLPIGHTSEKGTDRPSMSVVVPISRRDMNVC